jgi:homoserine kinase type II
MDENEVRHLLLRAEAIVKKHYTLGDVLSVSEIQGGYINRSFVVKVKEKDRECKYAVRRYNPATSEDDVRFEHETIAHLRKNGFDLAACVIPKKDGGTCVREQRLVEGREVIRFWAVFEYLRGVVRYTFIDTHLSDEETKDSAVTLARLHQAGRGFVSPSGADRAKTKIMDFLQTFREAYSGFAALAGKTRFDGWFLEHRAEMLDKLDRSILPEADLERMPELPIHGDYHQGNLTYEGSRVAGVFDFDWTKVDIRLFDLAQSLLYFCACWDGDKAGTLDLAKFSLFLKSYNDGCRGTAFPGPLNELEQSRMPLMMAAATQFVLHVIIRSFYDTEEADVDDWLMAVDQYIRIMRWLEEQDDRIADRTRSACKMD